MKKDAPHVQTISTELPLNQVAFAAMCMATKSFLPAPKSGMHQDQVTNKHFGRLVKLKFLQIMKIN